MRDIVRPWVAQEVARRDDFRCVAPSLDGTVGWCHDRWGNVITRWERSRIDSDKVSFCHVKDFDGQAMGKRADSEAGHLLLLCWGHHEGAGERGGYCWGTSKKGLEKQRDYLAQFDPGRMRTARL